MSSFLFFVSCDLCDLHSFPTRRSSDLPDRRARRPERDAEPARSDDDQRDAAGDAQAARRAQAHRGRHPPQDRKSTRLNSSHLVISYAVFCLKKQKIKNYYVYLTLAHTV